MSKEFTKNKSSIGRKRGDMSFQEKIKFMIVDDNDWIRFSLKIGLESTDITCVADTSSISKAVELCEKLHPDILLLDMYLVNENGWESIPNLLEASPKTKIIAISAFAGGEMIKGALEKGAIAFISKSGSLAKIREEIITLAVT